MKLLNKKNKTMYLKRMIVMVLTVVLLTSEMPQVLAEVVNVLETVRKEDISEVLSKGMTILALAGTENEPRLTMKQALTISGTGNDAAISKNGNTLTVNGASGLILLSNVLPEEYNGATLNLVTTESGWDVTQSKNFTYVENELSFIGLGKEGAPFSGTLTIPAGSTGLSIKTMRALFNCLSTDATLPENINFLMAEPNTESILADTVVKGNDSGKTLSCGVTFHNSTGEGAVTVAAMGGIIGTLGENAKVKITLTNNIAVPLSVSGSGNRGLFCNTMQAGASLTAIRKSSGNSAITVNATSGHAGGFVGQMASGAVLSVSGGTIETVTSRNGNAGGLVGSADHSTIQIASALDFSGISVTANNSGDAGGLVGSMIGGATITPGGAINFSNTTITSAGGNAGGLAGSADDITFESSNKIFVLGTNTAPVTITSGSKKSAGGLVGAYSNTRNSHTIDLKQFEINVSLGRTGSSITGGVFGTLTNTGNLEITDSGYVSDSTTAAIKVSSALTGTEGNPSVYGGLIGTYASNSNLSKELILNDLSISSASSAASNNYGGVIGTLPTTCYVKMENLTVKVNGTVTATTKPCFGFGGLIGCMGDTSSPMVNIGNVTLSSESKIKWEQNKVHGGLIGFLNQGVVRLYGITDCTALQFGDTGERRGQIVGRNEDGLLYAVGDGNGNYGAETGWLFKRYDDSTITTTNEKRNGSDIGNWGEVVRLDGTKLTEGNGSSDTDLLYFNENDHTVTVKSSFGTLSNNTYTIKNMRDFAAYALAFNCVGDGQPVLKFAATVDPGQKQTVSLEADIDLTGTGILGIGRDIDREGSFFFGSFDGKNHTVALDIGGSYGKVGENIITADAEGNGRIYVNGNGIIAHSLLALFARVGNANTDTTIKNVAVSGAACFSVMNGSNLPLDAAGLVAYQKGKVTYDNITSSIDIEMKAHPTNTGNGFNLNQAGILAEAANDSTVVFNNCEWSSNSKISNAKTYNNSSIGGFLGYAGTNNKIAVRNSNLCGTIEATGNYSHARVGGFAAVTSSDTVIEIKNLNVDGVNIKAAPSNTCGGLLGYQWDQTTVTFGGTNSAGVTIQNATLNAGQKAIVGGLVYQATGYWNATAANSIKFKMDTKANSFVGKSNSSSTSGLLVGTGLNNGTALYIEVGTWGSDGAAYYVEPQAVALSLTNKNEYFDELVGTSISNNEQYNNAVVSLAVRDNNGKIDPNTSTCNTYKGQLKNFKNKNTRYYYNLDSYRENGQVDAGSLTSSAKVLSWSVSQYAANNIRSYFCSNASGSAKISGDIDLTGYSYYPVTPLSTVELSDAKLTFANQTMEAAEAANKMPSVAEHQHYLMHHGLLYNTNNRVTVDSAAFSGTVGKTSDLSGALIAGKVTGNTNNPNVISLSDVTLTGICVSGVDTETTYAPLLINQIVDGGVTLTVNGLSTGVGYTAGQYAASSLIGHVGSTTATKLVVNFSDIALDSRIKSGTGTSVNNNGDGSYKVQYNTYHTIFTQATLLDSFQYSTESSGSYTFNSTDRKVTYGKEISNTDSGRNPGEQYFYYDTVSYSWDGVESQPTNETIAEYYTTGYLRYVREPEPLASENTNNYRELDINIRPFHLNTGCGTYGHPYMITDGKQLVELANFLERGSASDWVVCVNPTVFEQQKQTSGSYHTSSADSGDKYYICKGEQWFEAQKGSAEKYEPTGSALSNETVDRMRAYLRNAYYMIANDIHIASNTYVGIGGSTTEKAFSGVIVGKKKANDSYPTVYISTQNNTLPNFGGLVHFSQGSVIKDLNVSYAGGTMNSKTVASASILISNDGPVSANNNPFFGGVVGYCMGGDTIIDNVSVTYGDETVTLSDNSNGYARLIAAGGYVGLAGGAVQTQNGRYELAGGGVIFRNMQGRTNPYKGTMADRTKENSAYFYCNPFVGRVLDGYACYDGGTEGTSTLDNTDKNYTIPDLVSGTSDLSVDNNLNISVNSAQGLWLLSAIVNCGAGAMDSTGAYKDINSQNIDAYQLGKVRSASYENIGGNVSDKEAALADEGVNLGEDVSAWGGIAGGGVSRVSYLVKNFTKAEDGTYYAAQLTGSSNDRTESYGNYSPNHAVTLTISADIDMSSYKNGFRGIGGSYGNMESIYSEEEHYNWRRNLLVKGIEGNNHTLTFAMNSKTYLYESNSNPGEWFNLGSGLFTIFMCTDSCEVKNLLLSGDVQFGYFQQDGTATYAFGNEGYGSYACVGGFAGRMMRGIDKNKNAAVTFNGLSLNDLSVGGVKTPGQNAAVGGAMYTGGVIGYVDDTNSNHVIFKTWPASAEHSVQVVSDGNQVCYTGGLIGCYAGTGTLTVGPSGTVGSEQVTRWDVDASKITVYSRMEQRDAAGACLGLLVGNGKGGAVTVRNINFKNVTVAAIRTSDVGGLIGKSQVKDLKIQNVTMENLSASSANCQKYGTTGDHAYYGLGGLVGCNGSNTVISNVCIKGNSKIYSNYDSSESAKPTINVVEERPEWMDVNVGGFIGNAELNGDNRTVIEDCSIEGTQEAPVRVLVFSTRTNTGPLCNAAGGLIGFDRMKNTLITDSRLSYVNILSPIESAALVGHENNFGLNVRNVAIAHCNVGLMANGCKNDQGCAGMVTGYTWGVVNAYNVLVKDSNLGAFSKWDGDSNDGKITANVLDAMQTMNPDNMGLFSGQTFYAYNELRQSQQDIRCSSIGTWIGQRGYIEEVSLVAVACDEACNIPLTDLGVGGKQENMNVVYADYPVVTGTETETGYPFLDMKPEGSLQVKASDTAEQKMLTGNGVGYMTVTGEAGNASSESIAKIIASQSSRQGFAKSLYYNVSDISAMLNITNDVYITAYQTEEKGNTIVPDGAMDFPILVVNGLADADTNVWNYIAALTNVKDGETAKRQANSVDAGTYKWMADLGSFVRQENASLGVDSTNKITFVKDYYDNQNSQFTLLDVKYKNPTYTGADSGPQYFHLYVPVLVKKVLYTKFNARFLAGTNYLAESYLSAGGYATAGFEEPVTALLTYNYDRKKSEWQQMLDNGDNLLWNYGKILDLARNNVDEIPLPLKTRLTLVDRQTSQCYTYTFGAEDDVHAFDLSVMKDQNGNSFKPAPICDLLGLTATEDENGTYVCLGTAVDGTEPDGATVKVGTNYYRKINGSDGDEIPKYTISAGTDLSNHSDKTNYLSRGEEYYLTIQVPVTEEVSVVNNGLSFQAKTMKNEEAGAPLATIRESSGASYVIYNGVQQSDLVISTCRVKNDQVQYDTKMENGDSIKVNLTSTLSLTGSGKENFANYAPSEVDHQFSINMKKCVNSKVEDVLIGASGARCTYTVKKADGTELYSYSYTAVASEIQSVLSMSCSSGIAQEMREYLKTNKDGTLTITAEIILPYPTLGTYFPAQSASDTEQDGVYVEATSYVASVVSQLPITSNKKKIDDTNRYYTENPTSARLTYCTYDGDDTGDATRKLGINPSDMDNDLDRIIYTNGDYDYSCVDAEIVSQATQIKYTLELFQKDDKGYDESNPLNSINVYLPFVETDEPDQEFTDRTDPNASSLSLTRGFTKKSFGHEFINIQLKPLTGSGFEDRGFTYANFKVRLTAVLLDQNGNELKDTKARDYIIYTNARIFQRIIQ